MLRRLLFAALVAAATTMPVGAESAGVTVIQDMWQSLADGRSGAPPLDRSETVNLLLLSLSLLLAARWLRRLPRRA